MKIPTPDNLSPQPDDDTKKGLPDFAADNFASDRVLHINLKFFKYGTNDKAHAAAIMLSLLLFMAIIIVIIIGMWVTNVSWAEKAFNWLGSAFLFSSGIALGGSGKNRSKKDNFSEND